MKVHNTNESFERRRGVRQKLERRGSAGRRAAGSRSFLVQPVESVEDEHYSDPRELVDELEEAGRKLEHSPSEEHLRAYCQLVRQFLSAAVQRAYRLQENVGYPRGGRRKLFMVVQVVDRKLDLLAREVLVGQRHRLAIAARLREIKGLLMDITG